RANPSTARSPAGTATSPPPTTPPSAPSPGCWATCSPRPGSRRPRSAPGPRSRSPPPTAPSPTTAATSPRRSRRPSRTRSSAATGDRTREEAVATVAAQLDAVLAGAAAGTDPVVLVSGISDDGAPAGLRLLASAGLGAGELSSPSTRQAGYVLATDQHAWLLDLLGVDPGPTSSVGAPARVATTTAPADVVAAAQDRERHSDAQRPLIPGFFLGLVLVNLTLFAAVAVGLRRPKVARRVTPHRGPVLRTLRALSLGVAAIPVASYLTNLLPWWRVEPPVLALLAGVVAT